MSRVLSLAESAAFKQLWLSHDANAPLLPQLLASLYSLEQALRLQPGFLANDAIIQANLRKICSSSQAASYQDLLYAALEGVKILDLPSDCIYGDFSDQFHLYKDNHDTIYRKTRSDSGIHFESVHFEDSDLASLDTGASMPDSDVDSLMDGPGDMTSCKFELHKILESIQTRHRNITSTFSDIDVKLRTLKSQNSSDLDFLDKLAAHNALMSEKTHDMRSEISEIVSELQSMKRESDVTPVPLRAPFQVPLDSEFLDLMHEKGSDGHLSSASSDRAPPAPEASYAVPSPSPAAPAFAASPSPSATPASPSPAFPSPATASAPVLVSTDRTSLQNLLLITILSILIVCVSHALKSS